MSSVWQDEASGDNISARESDFVTASMLTILKVKQSTLEHRVMLLSSVALRVPQRRSLDSVLHGLC